MDAETKNIPDEKDAIEFADDLRQLLHLHPRGTHFLIEQQLPGWALHAEGLLNLIDAYKLQSERVERLEKMLKDFKVWGTDGCRECETGRITLFITEDKCFKCRETQSTKASE